MEFIINVHFDILLNYTETASSIDEFSHIFDLLLSVFSLHRITQNC